MRSARVHISFKPYTEISTSLCMAGEVIAGGQDGTSRHPLKHALMVAIDNAAARDRNLWPIKSKDADTAGMSRLNRLQADTEAANPDSSTAAAGETSTPGAACISIAEHTAGCTLPPPSPHNSLPPLPHPLPALRYFLPSALLPSSPCCHPLSQASVNLVLLG